MQLAHEGFRGHIGPFDKCKFEPGIGCCSCQLHLGFMTAIITSISICVCRRSGNRKYVTSLVVKNLGKLKSQSSCYLTKIQD